MWRDPGAILRSHGAGMERRRHHASFSAKRSTALRERGLARTSSAPARTGLPARRMRAPDPKRLQIVERPTFAGTQPPARAGTPGPVVPSPVAEVARPGAPAAKDASRDAGAALASAVPAGAAR